MDLNQRLLVATEARARGEEATIDADWEQWLKEAAERGDLPSVTGMLNPTLTPATPSQDSVYWGREVSEYPNRDSAVLRARLPPPSQFFPLVEGNSTIATAVAVPPSAHPTGTAM